MPELDELIASLRERVRTRSTSENKTEDKVYDDEKIIFTADQLRSFRPPELREMRRMAQSKESIRWSESRLFYEQARFMEDFEDDRPYEGSVDIYFPTYQRLSEDQLRGYFTWRAAVRKGVFDDSCTTFCFILIYEILHNIGVETPEEGARLLNSIWNATGKPSVKARIAEWAADYCAYYGLELSHFDVLRPRQSFESDLRCISDCSQRPDSDLYEAMKTFVPGYAERSALVAEHPEDHKELACRIVRKVAERYSRHSGKEYAESLYTVHTSSFRNMFRNAVFFDYKAPRMYDIVLSDYTEYKCRGANWMASGLGRAKDNNDLRMIFREADSLLRKHYGYTSQLKESDWSKEKKKLASRAMEEMLRDRKEQERRKVVFDFSLLEGIRSSSELMREKLIVPGSEEDFRDSDETDHMPVPEENADDSVAAVYEPSSAPQETILDSDERAVLSAILEGENALIVGYGMRLSILCDSINEKLYELLGDTAIEFDGNRPFIVEDYIDDVKGVLG